MIMKTTTPHTRGPLVIDTTCGASMETVYLIETADGINVGRTNKEADAILFSQASNLLSALTDALDWLKSDGYGKTPEYARLKEVAAKAQGNA